MDTRGRGLARSLVLRQQDVRPRVGSALDHGTEVGRRPRSSSARRPLHLPPRPGAGSQGSREHDARRARCRRRAGGVRARAGARASARRHAGRGGVADHAQLRRARASLPAAFGMERRGALPARRCRGRGDGRLARDARGPEAPLPQYHRRRSDASGPGARGTTDPRGLARRRRRRVADLSRMWRRATEGPVCALRLRARRRGTPRDEGRRRRLADAPDRLLRDGPTPPKHRGGKVNRAVDVLSVTAAVWCYFLQEDRGAASLGGK
mmetsp:Transcript_3281/g.6056  ORF Transcript_3281/g.6056 Transcript_3281/m.6056 type:complete len:266 (-) Transcript_3281:75-872(-)